MFKVLARRKKLRPGMKFSRPDDPESIESVSIVAQKINGTRIVFVRFGLVTSSDHLLPDSRGVISTSRPRRHLDSLPGVEAFTYARDARIRCSLTAVAVEMR